MTEDFAHLHVHSHYSLLDGKSTCREIVEKAASLGQSAVAITDHGNAFGHYDFYQEAHRVGIKPILGCELYYAPAGRGVRESLRWYELEGSAAPGRYTHLSAWALGATGLRNLYECLREANDTGMYYKPRVDLGLLGEHSDGIAIGTGCMGSEVSVHLRAGEMGRARDAAAALREVFPGRLFVEVMYHGIPGERELVERQLELAKQMGLPAIATNDSHYTSAEDAHYHDCLLSVQTRSKLADSKRFRFNGSGYDICSVQNVRGQLISGGVPRAQVEALLHGTMGVAGMVDGSYGGFFRYRDLSPQYVAGLGGLDALPVLVGSTRVPGSRPAGGGATRVQQEVRYTPGEGVRQNDSHNLLRDAVFAECPPFVDYEERLEYELSVIERCGFSDYFLVLADICRFCREKGIRLGPGRGSVGGSLVAYELGITDIDPIAHGLLFERFLNPARPSPPDIDVDVQDDRRSEVLDYISGRYGAPRVATVMALNTIGAKAALHDAAFVLGYPRGFSNGLTYRLPPMVRGRAPSLSEMDKDGLSPEEEEAIDVAESMEGLIRTASQHAAAVIISNTDLTNVLPVWKKNDRWVTGFDGKTSEKLGLTKFDLLGLKTLRVIDECLRLVQKESDSDGSGAVCGLPTDYGDRATYQLLSSGNTLGCFQVEGAGMQRLLRSVQPGSLGEIAAVLALYRPGPMDSGTHEEYARRKRGASPVDYPHPEFAAILSDVLDPTYGLIVYQEQVMEILNRVCGWGYAEAGVVFNALRKKDQVALARSEPEFREAAKHNGFSHEAVDALWQLLVPFADYSFNKSHAIGYAILCYHTAFLKANHSAQYMAALLSAESDPEKQEQYVQEATKLGITILPPDVNESGAGWTVSGGNLRCGLAAIRGVGNSAIRDLQSQRPFRDFDDLLRRIPQRSFKSNLFEALFSSGAIAGLPGGGDPSTCTSGDLARILVAGAATRDQGLSSNLFSRVRLSLPGDSVSEGSAPVGRGSGHVQYDLLEPLTQEEWIFLLTVCLRYPGENRLTLLFKGRTLRVPAHVSQPPPEIEFLGKIRRTEG